MVWYGEPWKNVQAVICWLYWSSTPIKLLNGMSQNLESLVVYLGKSFHSFIWMCYFYFPSSSCRLKISKTPSFDNEVLKKLAADVNNSCMRWEIIQRNHYYYSHSFLLLLFLYYCCFIWAIWAINPKGGSRHKVHHEERVIFFIRYFSNRYLLSIAMLQQYDELRG